MVPFIIAYLLFTVMYACRETQMRVGKDARNMIGGVYDKGSSILGILFLLICFTSPLIFILTKTGLNTISIPLQWFGVVLVLIGIVINLWSVRTLGKFYARTLLIQKDHKIIKHGPYSMVRHPGYLGASLVGDGLGLASGNIYVLLLIVVFMGIYYTYRIHFEELMLLDEFGKEYEAYQKHTKRLIPFVY